jgi:L-lactate dehydrogenase complex protein LldG
MTAREEILQRVRTALRPAAGVPAPEAPPVPRTYRRSDQLPPGDRLDLLAERLTDYRALVHCGPDPAKLLVAAVQRQGVRSLVVPDGVPRSWLAALPGEVELVRDEPPLSAIDLDRVGGVITGCRVAIAETGTIVLDGGPDQGRRALSLVPDTCLVVVRPDQVVVTVPEAIERLDPIRPLTWISGPSATSDIELSRVEGVHGPRTLEVLLLTDD